MIIQIKKDISKEQQDFIVEKIKSIGYKPSEVNTGNAKYLVCIGKNEFDIRLIGKLHGVEDVHRVSDAYKLVSRKWKVEATRIDLGNGVYIGENDFSIMAGPCSVENEEQVIKIADHLLQNNIKIMRGGVFKPRSSPYSFRGLGLEGLKMFSSVCHERGIKIISEVMQVSQIAEMYEYIDIFQVGARNSQNFNLLDELGKVDKPVMIKRGMSGTIDELLQSAEYIFTSGNEKLILCERGIRTYENAYRNTFDLNAIPVLKQKTHLPVIADPSHGIGIRDHVPAIALGAVMTGADGVIFEIHPDPHQATSDGEQTLNLEESSDLFRKLKSTRNFLENNQ